MLKRFLHIVILFLVFTSAAFAQEQLQGQGEQQQEKPKDVIASFSSKIKKSDIILYWSILNPDRTDYILIDQKKPGEAVYERLNRFTIKEFDRKTQKDSLDVLEFSFRNTVDVNGVYYFKILLFDRNNNQISENEIKMGISGIQDFKLMQNNPNPFNPSTMISYRLFKPTYVTLKVYSLTGKEVATLVDAQQSAGTFTVEFNAINHPDISSGIYFYKLQTEYSSDIKKMILTK
ncbi:MAG TPA: T9SS type A sorting domain-containing protein [Ignavibacteria bacterium]|nr:T9SS type A sorting domain-containing protein [Ignavibacteria bacterium]